MCSVMGDKVEREMGDGVRRVRVRGSHIGVGVL